MESLSIPLSLFRCPNSKFEMMWAVCSCEGSLGLEDEELQGWARNDLYAKPLVI